MVSERALITDRQSLVYGLMNCLAKFWNPGIGDLLEVWDFFGTPAEEVSCVSILCMARPVKVFLASDYGGRSISDHLYIAYVS